VDQVVAAPQDVVVDRDGGAVCKLEVDNRAAERPERSTVCQLTGSAQEIRRVLRYIKIGSELHLTISNLSRSFHDERVGWLRNLDVIRVEKQTHEWVL
jgi:hypothetical protein